MLAQISGPVLSIQGSRFCLFYTDIVINSGDLNRNGANHWQIINFAPWRLTLLVIFGLFGRETEQNGESQAVRRKVVCRRT